MASASSQSGTPAPAMHGATGAEIFALMRRLYPICRSITGDGVRQTLAIVNEIAPLAVSEVPTGTPVFDWEVPKEWRIRDAWIKDRAGNRLVDFRASNLHVVNYSAPVHATMELDELKAHLHTLPDRPDWIPYRTTYWKETWGFCLAHRQMQALAPGRYEVLVDSELFPGSLSYGECVLPGESSDEVLLFTHVCHPSLCNDNCSGIAFLAHLARALAGRRLRYTYRLLFAPGTIGSLTWLSRNEAAAARVRFGLVLTGFGDPGGFTYKRSRRGDAAIDRIVPSVLADHPGPVTLEDFSPYGYDERQFCSPGFNLPLGRLSRTAYGRYPEYHTSADNPDFVRPERLEEAFNVCLEIIDVIEHDRRFLNTCPKGEPRLGKRGLFRPTGGTGVSQREEAMLWLLNQSDGAHSVLDIAQRANIPFAALKAAADDLLACGLLIEAAPESTTHSGR